MGSDLRCARKKIIGQFIDIFQEQVILLEKF